MKILNLGTVTLIAVATTLLIGCNRISGIDEIEFASSGTDTNISSSTDSQSDSNIPKNTDNGSDSGSDSDTNIEVGSDTHSDIDTTTNTDTNPGSNTDTDTNTDTGADTDTGTENSSDSDSDSDSDSYADCSALADGDCKPCYECMIDVDGGSCFDDAMICWGDTDCAPFNDCRNECGPLHDWWGEEFDACVEACPGAATWAPVIDAMHTCIKAVCTEC